MTRLEFETPSGVAWADIDRPDADPAAAVFMGHGAGGGVEAPDMLATRDAAVAAGWVVARITQPYRVAGRRSPAPAPRLDEAWLAVSAALHDKLGPLPTVHCGRSSGARVACRTAAQTSAIAVITLAFPVHPPGKPERSRMDELDAVRVPVLAVQGERDPFGMPPKRRGRRLVVIDGADHALRRGRPQIMAAVTDFLRGLP
jgi:predicted alpha/beta-hydrolase family hydrolase